VSVHTHDRQEGKKAEEKGNGDWWERNKSEEEEEEEHGRGKGEEKSCRSGNCQLFVQRPGE